MLNIFSKIFSSSNDRAIKDMMHHVKTANSLEEELSKNHLSIKPLKGQGDQQLIKLEGIIQHLQEIL